MTTILAILDGDKSAIYGDGRLSSGSFIATENAVKVGKVGKDVILGIAGCSQALGILNTEPFVKPNDFLGIEEVVELVQKRMGDNGCTCLAIVNEGGNHNLYYFTESGAPSKCYSEFEAVGSGRDLVTGAFQATGNAELAMKIAAKYDTHSNDNITKVTF